MVAGRRCQGDSIPMAVLSLRLVLGILVMLGLACSAAPGGRSLDTAAHESAGVVYRDLAYGVPRESKLADIHRPVGAESVPAVVLVHGGSWSRGSRRRMEGIAEQIMQHGYVAMNIEYRFAPDYRHPTQLVDVFDAVCWLRGNAAAFGVDPARIVVWGYSAGAHLSLLAANRSGRPPAASACVAKQATVQAAVGGAAPTDLRLLGQTRPVRDLLGGAPAEVGEGVYLEASPLFGVDTGNPPTFLYHGRGDWVVDIEHSRRMRNALADAGVTVELFETAGGHVSEGLFPEESVDRALDFLDRELG